MGRATAYALQLTAKPEPLSVDLQAAVTVLGRLPTRRGVNRADLSDVNLAAANFFRANLTGAILVDANLTGASLASANLTGAIGNADLTRPASRMPTSRRPSSPARI